MEMRFFIFLHRSDWMETDGGGRFMKVALIPKVPVDILLGVRDSISPGQQLKEYQMFFKLICNS